MFGNISGPTLLLIVLPVVIAVAVILAVVVGKRASRRDAELRQVSGADPNSSNLLALLSLIFSLLGASVVAIVLGHIALVQINRTGQRGRGLCVAGLIIGYFALIVTIIAVITYVSFAASVSG